MASAYGIIHNYGEPQSTFDEGLALQALEYKQKKYDANTIKIEQTLNKFGIKMNQLVREEDKEHLYQRVNKLINGIQGLKGADLGKRSVTQGIIGHIGQALDERTIKNLGISQNIQNYQATAMASKEEGNFSQGNYQAGLRMSGYQDYMNGAEGLSAPLNYTPYTNVNEAMTEVIKNAKSIYGKEFIETVDKYGNKKTVNIENATMAEWMTYLPGMVPENVKAQLQINGAIATDFNDAKATLQKQQALKQITGNINSKISNLENSLATPGITPEQEEIIEEEIAKWGEHLDSTKDRFSRLKGYKEIGYALQYQNMLQGYSTWAGSNPEVSWDVNESYYKEAAKAEKIRKDLLEKEKEKNRIAYTSTENPIIGSPDLEVETFRDERETAINNFETQLTSAYEYVSGIGKLGENEKTVQTLVDNKVAEILKENPEIGEGEARYKAMLQHIPNNAATIKNGVKAKLREAHNQKKMANEILVSSYEQFSEKEVFQKNSVDLLNTLKENSNITFEVNGESVRVEDYFSEMSQEEFNRFLTTNKGKQLKTQIYVDYLIPTTGIGGDYSTDNIASEKGKKQYFNRLAVITGEGDISYNEFFITEEVFIPRKGMVKRVTINPEYKDSKMSRLIEKRKGMSDRGISRDNTFYDDDFIKGAFSYKQNKEDFADRLRTEQIRVAGTNTIVLNEIPATATAASNTPWFAQLQGATSNPSNLKSFRLEAGVGSVYLTYTGGNFHVRQVSTKDVKNEEGIYESQNIEHTAVIPESTFADLAPQLYSQMERKREEGELVYAARDVEILNIDYPPTTRAIQEAYVTKIGANLANIATKKDAKLFIKQTFPNMYQGASKGYGEVLSFALNNPQKFKATFKVKEGEKSINMYINTGTQNTPKYKLIDTIDADEYSNDRIETLMYTAPQVLLTKAVQKIGEELVNFDYEIKEAPGYNILFKQYQKSKQ